MISLKDQLIGHCYIKDIFNKMVVVVYMGKARGKLTHNNEVYIYLYICDVDEYFEPGIPHGMILTNRLFSRGQLLYKSEKAVWGEVPPYMPSGVIVADTPSKMLREFYPEVSLSRDEVKYILDLAKLHR